MLKIIDNPTFDATASINLKALQASFGVKFRLLSPEALERVTLAWTGRSAGDGREALPATLSDADFVHEVLAGFQADVLDEHDQPLAYTTDNVDRLLATPGARQALIDAFFSGFSEAEAKNSEPPPVG